MQVAQDRDGNLSMQRTLSHEAASSLAEEITRLVDGRRIDRVIVVGCQQIELLVQLAHRGFADVTCRAGLAGPNAGELSADLIIVPAVDHEPRLTLLLSRVVRGLRPEGLLLLCIGASPFTTRVRQTRKALRQSGFEIVQRQEPSGLHVLCCRKIPALQMQAA
jgi:hypothetical protein